MLKSRIIMLGPSRSVHGGISAVINDYYAAGLNCKVDLRYIGTMVDGNKFRKLTQACTAYVCFLFFLPFYEIIHVNMASDASYYRKKIFIDTAYFFHKKIVIHEHGGNFKAFYKGMNCRQQDNVKKTLNKADVFIVLSQEWKDFFSDIVTKIQIQIVHNAVPVPEKEKSVYTDHNILYLGRICADKGMKELLYAIDKVHTEVPDVHLYLAGNYEEKCWKTEVEKRSAYVTCTGWITGSEKEKLMQDTCSVFVLPSYYEGQPISLMEAMSYGMAPVSSNIGGITEMMSETEGISVPIKDARALTEALRQIICDTGIKRAFGTASRKKIIDEYNIDETIDRLCEIYSELSR